MNIRSRYDSLYINAGDLETPITLTIDSVNEVTVGDEDKVTLAFIGAKKELVLNKTNAFVLADLYGDDTDEWPGKRIMLKRTKVEFQGKKVDGVRLFPPASGKGKAKASPSADANGDAASDDIPF